MNRKVLINNSEKGFFRVVNGVGIGINPKGQENDRVVVDINDLQVQSLISTGCFTIEEVSETEKVETTIPQQEIDRMEQLKLTAKALEDKQNQENSNKLEILKQTATMMEKTTNDKKEFINKLAKDTAEQLEKQSLVDTVKDAEKKVESKDIKKVTPVFGKK